MNEKTPREKIYEIMMGIADLFDTDMVSVYCGCEDFATCTEEDGTVIYKQKVILYARTAELFEQLSSLKRCHLIIDENTRIEFAIRYEPKNED